MNNNKNDKDVDQLNAFVDGELDEAQRESLLHRLDDDLKLRAELTDIHHVKDLVQFAYPLNSDKKNAGTTSKFHFGAIAASFLLVLALGFLGGYLTTFNQALGSSNKSMSELEKSVVQLSGHEKKLDKVLLYVGSSHKEKFDKVLDKAESLLTKYKNEGTEVSIVASAGGIDLLRTSNTVSKERIKTMSGLYKKLNFIACNTQIYYLHENGLPVNLVDEVVVAPSAVQFVVDHLKKGWKYIAI